MRDREHNTRDGSGFNRRDFLKGSGAAVAATAMATTVPESSTAAAPGSRKVVAAGPTNVTLNVNGKNHTLRLEPRAVLLDVLRNDLDLTGCKRVDDRTATGADTVLIDGKAVMASSRLAIDCEGQKIVTIESLTGDGPVDEVIAGFVKHDASQCGFCTPGFVMAVKGLLIEHPHATLDQIREGLGDNVCRCGTYHGIIRCALELAKKGGA